MKTIFTIFTTLFFLTTLHAQVFVKQDATGNNDGTSWANAYSNLQDAFDNANTGDQIWIAAGTYIPMNSALSTENWFAVNQGLEIYGGFVGTETMLSERDWEANITTLSGDVNGDDVDDDFDNFRIDNAIHVLWISGGDQNILDGLVISGGQTSLDTVPFIVTSADVAPWSGGGCYVTANATIRNCTFRQCNGTYGAALEAEFAEELLVEHCIFENNKTLQGAAGFRWMDNPVMRNCHFENNFTPELGAGLSLGLTNALVEDCTFENNISEIFGGGIFIFQNSLTEIDTPSIQIRKCEFINNNAVAGGGLSFNNFYPTSQIIIDSCLFFQNTNSFVDIAGGGALLLQNLAGGGLANLSAIISNSTFQENSSQFGGGAYFFSNNGNPDFRVSNCDFIENNANQWGGGLVFGNIDGVMEDCTFQKNEANSIGGGLFVFQNSSRPSSNPEVKVERCDFQENQALGGGGIAWNNFFPNSNIEIDSVTFFQNTADGGGAGVLLQNYEDNFGGGIPSFSASVTNSIFEENITESGAGGYFFSNSDTMEIFTANNSFIKNIATVSGGGLYVERDQVNTFMSLSIYKTIFSENETFQSAAALENLNVDQTVMETVLMNNNIGVSTTSNSGNLSMTNTTMIDNEGGMVQSLGGLATLQNNIFANSNENYFETGDAQVITQGGNISSDATFVSELVGFGAYADYNETDPQLDMNFVPSATSIAIDVGNPDGITTLTDLAGVDRIQGDQIDIGAFESPFLVATENLNTLDIEIYPNPFVDYLTISDTEGITGIRLLDVLGREVQQFSVQKELNVKGNLLDGIYFLELDFDGEKYLKKVEQRR